MFSGLVILILAMLLIGGAAMFRRPRTGRGRVIGPIASLVVAIVVVGYIGADHGRVSLSGIGPVLDAAGNIDRYAARLSAEADARPRKPEPNKAEKPIAEKPEADRVPPTPRPDWVDRKPTVEGDGYWQSVTIGPYTSQAECVAHLPEALTNAVDDFVAVYIGEKWRGRLHLDVSTNSPLIREQWEEPITASFGPMVQLHLLLKFDRAAKDQLNRERDQFVVARRLRIYAAAILTALLIMAIGYVGLKIDLATGGAHRQGLLVAAAAILIAIITAAIIALSALG